MNNVYILSETENMFEQFGYLIIFLSSLIEITPFGWTIPGGLILATGGFFAYGKTNFLIGILISGWLGAWSSLVLGYILGKKTGLFLVKKLRQEKIAQKAKRLLDKNGAIVLTSSMLANLTRFWSAYFAGVENYQIFRFLLYSGVTSLSWVSLMVFIGFLGGAQRGNIEKLLNQAGIVSWLFLIITILIIFFSIKLDKEELNNGNNQNK
jgi:membrane protein DedA with SNARE-associated domain